LPDSLQPAWSAGGQRNIRNIGSLSKRFDDFDGTLGEIQTWMQGPGLHQSFPTQEARAIRGGGQLSHAAIAAVVSKLVFAS